MNHAPPPRRRELNSSELNQTTWTFSAPLLYEKQVEQIETEVRSGRRAVGLKKVMDPEYESRELQVFVEVAKKRNAFATFTMMRKVADRT